MSMQEMDYNDRKHAEQTERINTDIQREAARKTEAAEAKEPVEWSPDMERDFHLEKQRERLDQISAETHREAIREAERAERRERQRQAVLSERAAWQARDSEPEVIAARERASAEYQALLDAEVKEQLKFLPEYKAYDPWSNRTVKDEATERARAVLKQRAAEVQPESLECRVARLEKQIAAIDEHLRGITKRYASAG